MEFSRHFKTPKKRLEKLCTIQLLLLVIWLNRKYKLCLWSGLFVNFIDLQKKPKENCGIVFSTDQLQEKAK